MVAQKCVGLSHHAHARAAPSFGCSPPMLPAGAQVTGGPCIRGFADGGCSEPACLADGAARCAQACSHDPFSQKIRPQRSRKSVRMPAGREPCDAHPRLSLSVQVRLANFARPARIHLDRATDRPEPELRSRIPNEPEGRRKPHNCDAPGHTNPTPMRPWCPRQSRPPRPCGLRRHGFPRSHGPPERKVKGQWLTLGCCADPGPNRTSRHRANRPRMEIPNEPERRRNPGKQSQNLLWAPQYMPDAALSPILFDHIRRLLGDHLVRPARIHLDRATAPPEPDPDRNAE